MGSSCSDCDYNTIAEALAASLGCERLQRSMFRIYTEVQMALFDDLEGFSNHNRCHSALGYWSPADYDRHTQFELAA